MRYIVLIGLLIFSGCGYKSAAHYAQSVMGEKVSTEVVISLEDPQNTVIIKDAVDMAVITKFRSSLASKEMATTHLKLQLGTVSFTPLRYNVSGYVVAYRTLVRMNVIRTREGKSQTYTTSGVYDFEIEANAIISDQARFNAISQSAQKAIDVFIAQVAAQGTSESKE